MHPITAETVLKPADLSVEGLLLDIDRFASHDGPGIRTTVFLKGCPLSCVWCHSPESRLHRLELIYQDSLCTGCELCIDACPEDAFSMGLNGVKQVAILDRDLCNLCGQCVEVCYPGALKIAGRSVTVGEVVSQVEKDLPYFRTSGGGVTLSGGEADPSSRVRLPFSQRLSGTRDSHGYGDDRLRQMGNPLRPGRRDRPLPLRHQIYR